MMDLRAAALGVLLEPDPDRKCALSQSLQAQWQAATDLRPSTLAVQQGLQPGRPSRPELVLPRQVPQRGLGTAAGRAALLHAVAHIEFNAINLAWDAVYRFADLPLAYYQDWSSVAADEARHFLLVRTRLRELGLDYGDLPAHDGLWQMALATEHALLERMALVPRVLEARGLDVTPGMIQRLREVGDGASIAVLEVILREEVRHVEIGTRWYRHACALAGVVDPDARFLDVLATHAAARVRPPFNLPARRAAGFSETELDGLPGLAQRIVR